MSPVTTANSSSEFNPFSAVGALLTGGEGGKCEVWVLDKSTSVCLGKVGMNNCGIQRHGSKFSVAENITYIHASDNQAHCLPSLDLSMLSSPQQELLRVTALTPTEWEQFFLSIQNGIILEWLEV
jgi:hypothetical protein